jgi:hypothetical protein
MSVAKLFGAVLVVIGIVGLLYGGVSWTRQDTIIDAGPIEVSADRREGVSIPPIVGGLSLVAGLGVLFLSVRR